MAIKPGSCPAKLLVKFLVGNLKSEPLTLVMELTTLDFFCVPKPTTTASSSSSLFSVSMIVLSSKDSTLYSTLLKPTYVKINSAPILPLIVNDPSAAESVDSFDPTTEIFTPAKASLSLSTTLPRIVVCLVLNFNWLL